MTRASRTFNELKADWMRDPEFRKAYGEADAALRLGMRVRELRLALGLTKSQLATKVGISPASISRIELGSPEVRLQTMARLSEALGTKLVVELVPGTAG